MPKDIPVKCEQALLVSVTESSPGTITLRFDDVRRPADDKQAWEIERLYTSRDFSRAELLEGELKDETWLRWDWPSSLGLVRTCMLPIERGGAGKERPNKDDNPKRFIELLRERAPQRGLMEPSSRG